ncbi:MAG: TlpA disulfide reductase family protein [Vicinamibacterales bacterium]
MTRRGLTVLLCVLGLAAAGAAQEPARPAPPLDLPAADGSAVSLASLRGKVVLVDVWASWCAPCKAAFPEYDRLHKEYRERGFEVLAVNVDERRADADRFLAGRTPAMTVVFDPAGVAPERLGVRGMPTSFLIDRRGQIRHVHEGFTTRDLATYRRRIEALLAEVP